MEKLIICTHLNPNKLDFDSKTHLEEADTGIVPLGDLVKTMDMLERKKIQKYRVEAAADGSS